MFSACRKSNLVWEVVYFSMTLDNFFDEIEHEKCRDFETSSKMLNLVWLLNSKIIVFQFMDQTNFQLTTGSVI